MARMANFEQGEAELSPEHPNLDELRLLTEVDHLNRLRSIDGQHSMVAVEGVRRNLIPGVKEAAMPYAVSTTYQEYADGQYWWIDQTPEQVAASGYRFHEHPAALVRVDVEIEEAQDLNNLRPGVVKVLISPRMSPKDASHEIAKHEHLADDDMIRMHMVDMGPDGQPRGKFMQSVLLRHVPLSAWVAMLRDPRNIFGKAIEVEDEASALSVMKVHNELEVPEAALPKGVISIIEAVLPYADPASQTKIREELKLFSANQNELHTKAEVIAERWLQFEMDLADSLHYGYATPSIQQFIRGLAQEWSGEFVNELIRSTTADGRVVMSRSLGAKLEASKRNTLWVSGGVVSGNARIVAQLKPEVAQEIYVNEMMLQTAIREGLDAQSLQQIEITNDKLVAQQNVTAGAGCPGAGNGFFASLFNKSEASHHDSGNEKCREVKDGQSVKCPGCKKQVKAIVPNREKIYCSNPRCALAAPHIKDKSIPKPQGESPSETADAAHELEQLRVDQGDSMQERSTEKEKQAKPLGELALQA